jgi:hypothetical protein
MSLVAGAIVYFVHLLMISVYWLFVVYGVFVLKALPQQTVFALIVLIMYVAISWIVSEWKACTNKRVENVGKFKDHHINGDYVDSVPDEAPSDFKNPLVVNRPSIVSGDKLMDTIRVKPSSFPFIYIIISVLLSITVGVWITVSITKSAPSLLPPGPVGEFNLCTHFEGYATTGEETEYVCKGFKLPNDKSYHLIRFEPLINNPDMVHHMILYSSIEDFSARGYFRCSTMPQGSLPMFAWGLGVEAFEL